MTYHLQNNLYCVKSDIKPTTANKSLTVENTSAGHTG